MKITKNNIKISGYMKVMNHIYLNPNIESISELAKSIDMTFAHTNVLISFLSNDCRFIRKIKKGRSIKLELNKEGILFGQYCHDIIQSLKK